jgi:hypothetical protein
MPGLYRTACYSGCHVDSETNVYRGYRGTAISGPLNLAVPLNLVIFTAIKIHVKSYHGVVYYLGYHMLIQATIIHRLEKTICKSVIYLGI